MNIGYCLFGLAAMLKGNPPIMRINSLRLFPLWALTLCLLAACSSSGGGSSTASTPAPAPIPAPAPTPAPPTLTAEQIAIMRYENFPAYSTADNHLPLINAATAYARGATGMGETIVIVDSGIDASHREFQGGKVRIITGIGNSCSPADASGGLCANSNHGTAVAAVAAGHRGTSSSGLDMHGVAFNAQIKFIPLALRGDSPDIPPQRQLKDHLFAPTERISSGDSSSFRHVRYRQYIAQGEILNYSFGSPWSLSEWKALGANCGNINEIGPYACYKDYYRLTANALAQTDTHPANKSIVVTSAGNNYGARHDLLKNRDAMGPLIDASSPSAGNALAVAFNGANDPNLEHVITVVAVGADGIIASYSNRCGEAKAFCIAAPGGEDGAGILSASGEGNYASWHGTSFSAPIVSGSLALLRQYFRGQLGNTELVNRLLATAKRDGIYADSDVYGHGLVDLDAATAPVGAIMTGLPNDPASRPLAGSIIALSGGAFDGALEGALTGVEVAGFDALGAPFFQSAAAWVARPQQLGIERETRQLSPTSHYNNSGQRRSSGWSLSMAGNTITDARLAFADGWWASYGQHGGQSLGLYAQSLATPLVDGQGMTNMARRFNDPLGFAAPYLSLVRDGAGVGWSRSGDHSRFGFALMHGAPQHGQLKSGGRRGIGVLVSMTIQQTPAGGMSLQAGAVREADGFLGARPQGALGEAEAETTFIGINGAWTLGTQDWQLLASAYFGHTRPQIGASGWLHAASPIVSSAFSIGAARTSIWRPNDWFGLGLSQPLSAESGALKLRTPAGRTKYGDVVYQNHALSLVPAARAAHVDAIYRLPFAGGALKANIGLEHRPQHNTHAIRPFMGLAFERYF